MSEIDVTYFNDPGCPWGYSASPALAVLRWRYGEQLRWRLVMIGLTESAERYAESGYTPTRSALGQLIFRRYGMPFATDAPRPRARRPRAPAARSSPRACSLPSASWRCCGRCSSHGSRPTLLLDEDEEIARRSRACPGSTRAVVGQLDDPRVIEAYEADKLETRTAEGGPTEFQGKARQTDGRCATPRPR